LVLEFVRIPDSGVKPHRFAASKEKESSAMKSMRTVSALLVLSFILAAASAWAQKGHGGMGGTGSGPSMPGISNAVVGSGAAYHMNAKGKDMDLEYAVVGKEDVNGSPGIWMETRMTSAEMGGKMITKFLMVTTGSEAGIKRMIMQRPGQAPVEMGGFMMNMMKQGQPSTAKPDYGELVGTETITVPAGTFSCTHYRKQGSAGPMDYWVSDKVTPYAMAKMTGSDMTMVLTKLLSGETSQITGEPQKMPQMPHF
jgi:hypothetical protein